MITVDELRALRDAEFSQQLTAVEAVIDAQVQTANTSGTRTLTWSTTTGITEVQAQWLAERYASAGFETSYRVISGTSSTTTVIELRW